VGATLLECFLCLSHRVVSHGRCSNGIGGGRLTRCGRPRVSVYRTTTGEYGEDRYCEAKGHLRVQGGVGCTVAVLRRGACRQALTVCRDSTPGRYIAASRAGLRMSGK